MKRSVALVLTSLVLGSAPVAAQPAPAANEAFDTAVSCAAALQVATLAAPSWGREAAVAQATNLWLARVFELADAAGIGQERARDVVRAEMDAQVNAATGDPQALSRRAADCAANRPGPAAR